MNTKWARALRGIRTSSRANEQEWCPCLEQNYMTVQNKIIAKKILYVYKYTTQKNCRDSFVQWLGSSFLDYYILLCNKKIGSQAWVSLLFVPPGWGANSSQNCCPCSFCSHKQRCLTVLSELWSKVTFNSNTFFLELKAMNSSKSRWRCIGIHQNIWSRSFSQNC